MAAGCSAGELAPGLLGAMAAISILQPGVRPMLRRQQWLHRQPARPHFLMR